MNRIKQQREILGWTVRELAQKMGVTYTTISFWENGQKQPRPANKNTLAKVLKCPKAFLFPELSQQDNEKFNILLVEDDPSDAKFVKRLIQESQLKLNLIWVERLVEGINYLKKNPIDLVLLDLSLPDGMGIDTFQKIYSQVPDTPIVVLTGLDDEQLAITTLRGGAQDYLVKGEFDMKSLSRSIRYSIERQKILREQSQIKQELKEMNSGFQSVLQVLSEGVVLLRDGNVVDTNPRFIRIFGYSNHKEVLGIPFVQLLFVKEDMKTITHHIHSNTMEFRRFRGVRKNGERILVEICGIGTFLHGIYENILVIKEVDNLSEA